MAQMTLLGEKKLLWYCIHCEWKGYETNIKKQLKEKGYDEDTIDWKSYAGDIDINLWLQNEYGIQPSILRTDKENKGIAISKLEELRTEQIKEMKKQEQEL